MDTERGFLDAILDDPDDDAVRLVFSDWLEEHGDTARAEFIRVQCELARGVEAGARREKLRRRERELLLAHELDWVGPLRSVVRRATFVRGFVEQITVHANRLSDVAALLDSVPIRHLILLDSRDLAELADRPELRRITTLDLREGCALTAKGVREFAASPHLGTVTRLVMRQCRLNAEAVRALARSLGLARLRVLDLYDPPFDGAAPLPTLARSPHLAGLTELILGGTEFGDKGAAAFADARCRLSSLRRLHLSYCQIGDAGARILAGSEHLGGIESLDLTGNPIGAAGRRALRGRFGERVRM